MIGGDGELGLLIIGGGVSFMMGLFCSPLCIECERAKLKVDLGVPMHHLLPLIKTNLKIGRYRSPFLCVEAEFQYTKHEQQRSSGRQRRNRPGSLQSRQILSIK